MKKIIFICSGNTCRSPMAEGIFKVLLEKKGIEGFVCESAGTHAFAGDPAQPNAVLVAADHGADISEHRSRKYNPLMARDIDLFVCMSAQHALMLEGADKEKIRILAGGVADPFGGSLDLYKATANQIAEGLLDLLEELTAKNENSL
ncbi:MAG: low molecular weight phosphatase family protein [Clostridiales bacterium]|nr:low molecular weight phosphatase family protein [Clostridiales bacterium]